MSVSSNKITFNRQNGKEFTKVLQKRINTYFKTYKISKKGNWKLNIKAILMLILLLAPYILSLLIHIGGWGHIGLCILMGIGMAGVGMNVMHEGNHEAFSNKSWLNKLSGASMYLLAGNVYNWQVQHNVLHHSYTNIYGHDDDLDAGRIIRFSKHAPWKKIHRYQHLYGVLLYSLLTINWVITVDFKQSAKYLKQKLAYKRLPSPIEQWSTVIISKILYVLIWIALPVYFIELPWQQIIIGFVLMHLTAGFILSMIFQLAHVMEDTKMPLPEDDGQMKTSWQMHQLFTTCNFGTKNRFLHWFSGGLNFQIEHHLFPNISHIHYPKIAEIVKQTAEEFKLPYYEYPSMTSALISHFNHLKQLGINPLKVAN